MIKNGLNRTASNIIVVPDLLLCGTGRLNPSAFSGYRKSLWLFLSNIKAQEEHILVKKSINPGKNITDSVPILN